MIARNPLRWFKVRHPYTSLLDRQRASGLLVIAGATALFWLFLVVVLLGATVLGEYSVPAEGIVYIVLAPFVVTGLTVLVQRGRLIPASWLFVAFMFASMVATVTVRLDAVTVALLFVPVVLGSLLLGRQGTIIVSFIALLIGAMAAFTQGTLINPSDIVFSESVPESMALFIAALGLVAGLLYFLGGGAHQLVDVAASGSEQAQRVARFFVEADRSDEIAVFSSAIRMLRRDLNYTLAQIYLTDNSGHLTRRVRSVPGNEPVTMVRVGDASALTEAARERKLVVVTAQDSPVRREHLLPAVAHGAAIPIVDGDTLLGVMDVQDRQPFSTARLDVLASLASQVAAAALEARALRALRNDLSEQAEVVEGLRGQVRSLQIAHGLSSGSAWLDYFERRGQQAFGFNLTGGDVQAANDLPDHVKDALRAGDVRIEETETGQVIQIPIVLRDEVLGAMSFNVDKASERQIEMARNVAGRLALALENKRLLERSLAQAEREHQASEAASLLLSATDVDAVMRLAADRFNDAMGAVRTRIQLRPEVISEPPAPGRSESETVPETEKESGE